MVVHCNICKVECSTEHSYQNHVRGRKHQKVLSEFEERKQQAKCSLFVRGFPRQTTEEEIREYFSRFGDVVHIVVEDKRDLFAFVEFSGVEAPVKAIRQKRHFIGSHRVMVKQRIFKESSFRPRKCQMTMKKGTKGDKSNTSKEIEDPINPLSVNCALSGSVTVLEQMEHLCIFIRMTEEEIRKKRELCSMLEGILSKFFPGCTVHQFGSSVNGFGVRACDADIFLNLRETEDKLLDQHESVKLPYTRDIKTLKKNYGPLTSADLEPLTLYDKVKLVSRILNENAPGCNNMIAIPSARCPVVRFVYEPTDIKCDISVNNRIALKNSQLLWLFSCLDDRVRLLVYTVRYWAKMKDIAGSGTRLSNYALTFTVIYFLQNTNPPVLPTVEYLASLVPDAQDVINDWNCAFMCDVSKIPPSSNTDTADELLKKYFEFYSDKEFSTTVFQTRTAQAKSVSEFLSEYETQGFKSFKIGPISIQDPFVLDHNITGNVNNERKMKISLEFAVAACKALKWPKHKCRKRGDVNFGILDLLSDRIPPEVVSRYNTPEVDKHTFQIAWKDSYLLRKMPASNKHHQIETRLDWCRRVMEFTAYVLSDVLFVSVEPVVLAAKAGKERNEVQMDAEVTEQRGNLTCENPFVVKETSSPSCGRNSETSSTDPAARKRHSTSSSDETGGVKKCCYDSQDESEEDTEESSAKVKTNKVEILDESANNVVFHPENEVNENNNLEDNMKMETESRCALVETQFPALQSKADRVQDFPERMETESQCEGLDKDCRQDKDGGMCESVKMETDSQCCVVEAESKTDLKSVPDSEPMQVLKEDADREITEHQCFQRDVHSLMESIPFQISPTKTRNGLNNEQLSEANSRADEAEKKKGAKQQRKKRSPSKSPKLPRKKSPDKEKSRPAEQLKPSGDVDSLKCEFLCKVHCNTWQGRNKVKKTSLAPAGNNIGMTVEKNVSLKILEKNGFSKKALAVFRCKMDPVVTHTQSIVHVTLVAMENQSECHAFAAFFRSFVCRMLDRYLNALTLSGPGLSCAKDPVESLWADISSKIPGSPEPSLEVKTVVNSEPSCLSPSPEDNPEPTCSKFK